MNILDLINVLKVAIADGRAIIKEHECAVFPKESIMHLKSKINQFDRYPFFIFAKNNPHPYGIKHSYDLFCYLYGEAGE